jgi:hypothetical protein
MSGHLGQTPRRNKIPKLEAQKLNLVKLNLLLTKFIQN